MRGLWGRPGRCFCCVSLSRAPCTPLIPTYKTDDAKGRMARTGGCGLGKPWREQARFPPGSLLGFNVPRRRLQSHPRVCCVLRHRHLWKLQIYLNYIESALSQSSLQEF